MKIFVGILLLTGLAVVATSSTFLKLRRATLFGVLISGGWLGVLIGLAIGPSGIGLLEPRVVARATPLLTIGLGWIGLMVGLQLRTELLGRLPASLLRLAALDTLASFLIVAALSALGMSFWLVDATPAQMAAPVVLLGASAIGWAAEMRSLRLVDPHNTPLSITLTATAGLTAPISIVLFSLGVASIGGYTASQLRFDPGSMVWRSLGLTLIAAALGMIARFCLRRAGNSRSDLLTILFGVVALISGAATELRMSPLLSSMLVGVVIANLAGRELRRFERLILQSEHVVATLYWVVAGALLDTRIGAVGVAIAAALALTRIVVKPGLVRAVAITKEPAEKSSVTRLRRLAPIRQSPMALMLGVALVLETPSTLNHRLLTIITLTGLLCSLVAVWGALNGERRSTEQPRMDAADATGNHPEAVS